MRNSIYPLAVLLLVAFVGCKRPIPSPALDRQDMVTAEENASDTVENPPIEMDEPGHDESLGVKSIKGKLTTTKGHQAMVDGVMITTDYFDEDHQAAHRRISELSGKTVRITGEVIRYHCGPMEQCLSQGYIDSIRKVDAFEVLD